MATIEEAGTDQLPLPPRTPLEPYFANMEAWQYLRLLKSKLVYPHMPDILLNNENAMIRFRDHFFTLKDGEEDYCFSINFDPQFFAYIIRYGWLPICTHLSHGIYLLLPWIDPKRCVLDWHEVRVSKKIRRKSKKYSITCNQDFWGVIKNCVKQHGESWLYAPMRDILAANNVNSETRCVHSIELWDNETNLLVAGDIGYTVGGVYTSMTGFRDPLTKSVGTVQLFTTAKLLEELGFSFWDLGMVMDYKLQNLHAHVEDRITFLERYEGERNKNVILRQREKRECYSLLKPNVKELSHQTNTTKQIQKKKKKKKQKKTREQMLREQAEQGHFLNKEENCF